MSYSPTLGSVFNRTKMRDPSHVCSFSGMCAMCTADCIGSCEIGLSAVRGMETVYPTTTGENQIASEKVYPVDYSHFNINGRSFGAMGAPLDADRATIYHVGLEREIGTLNPVKLALPIILPALIKLNWPDYFGGAAMAKRGEFWLTVHSRVDFYEPAYLMDELTARTWPEQCEGRDIRCFRSYRLTKGDRRAGPDAVGHSRPGAEDPAL